METPSIRSATKIAVKDFRQIYVWPLVLDQAPDDGWLEATSKALEAKAWQLVADPWDAMADDGKDNGELGPGTYEEAVYFHDFVRDFLYKRDQGAGQRLFRRTDLESLAARIDGRTYTFSIKHCTLHVFRLGLAILTLELHHQADEKKRLTLAQAQTIIDFLRRTYAPFWFGPGEPGLCPSGVSLNGEDCGLGTMMDRASANAVMHETLREPLFPWWQRILDPLSVEGTDAVNAAHGGQRMEGPVFRQVLDERIPVITTLSLTSGRKDAAADLEMVSDGDWFRLAAADKSGTDVYPYNPDFLDGLRDTYFYDRFFSSPQTERRGATRFLLAGYHFAAVGSGEYFDDLLTEHVRRHYRQMYFIVHLEYAALLMISSRLSNAVEFRHEEKEFRACVVETEKEFLDFTHRYRFTGVSNQLQATELYDRMRESVGVDRLFRDVQTELQHATEFALALDQRDAARAAEDGAKKQEQLTEVATLGIVLGLVAGALGMNVLVGDPLAKWVQKCVGGYDVGLDFALVQAGGLLALTALGTWFFVREDGSARLKKALRLFVVAGLLALAAGGTKLLADQVMHRNSPTATIPDEMRCGKP